ncbi:MAG: T9SS type A sorting domain-containing protein [Bacteroidaceae bacterium]|nr:T9SS type A sorting domain-containing protein [Bacteroidaceae bacterium]
MRKTLLTLALLFTTTAGVMADSVITLKTSKQYGDILKFTPVPAEAGTIKVDWGDGNLESYEMKPNDMAYNLRKEHKLMGQTVKIYGALSELTCSEQKITAVALEEQSTLKKLSLNKNQLTYETTDLGDAYALTMLNLAENEINILNLQKFEKLQYVDLYGNKDLTTVVFAKDNHDLKGITAYDTDLIHFYDEYNFQNLTTLDLHNTSLTEVTFAPEHYPKLTTLNLNKNHLATLDVSGLTTLESLSISKNRLTSLNISANTELRSLSVDGNKGLSKLNLANNAKMSSLNVSSTSLESLDLHNMPQLGSLYADSLRLSKLDVSELAYLKNLSVDACDLSYLDFTANYFNLKELSLRGNKNFTAQSLNFMYKTIHNPTVKKARIYVSGTTGAKEADAETYLRLDDYDTNWKIDVEGDGSASMSPVQLTLLPAKGGTYKVFRRNMSDKVENVWVKNYEEATDGKVTPGYVNVVRFVPDEGMGFRGVKINGKMVKDSLFFVTADAEIEAVFGEGNDDTMDKYVAFSVPAGQDSQYGFAADKPDTNILIDWGDGKLVKGNISNTSFTYFDGKTEGTTVKVYGDVSYINVESYPYGYGIDNCIKAIDLSNNGDIRQLNAYFNQLQSIDVTNQPKLVSLNIAMNEDINKLDVSKNPELRELQAYTTDIAELDLQNNGKLQYLDVKNTSLCELNVDGCKELTTLIASNNELEELNVANLPKLDILQASGNYIESIDLSNNTKMRELTMSHNMLTELDLSKNKMLEKISVSSNNLDRLDLSNNTYIWYVDARANRWDACTVNEFIHLLPPYVSPGEEAEASTTATKLLIDGEDETTNRSNDVAHSETRILNGKNWISNIIKEGDGTGCDRSYVYIIPAENGEISLVDDKGENIPSGTAVKKGTELTVVTTPASDYTASEVLVNGKGIEGSKFVVSQLSDVTAKFSLVSTGINGTKNAIATAEGGINEIRIESNGETEVSIESVAGKNVYKSVVKGSAAIELPAGIYVVTLKSNNERITRKLMVR